MMLNQTKMFQETNVPENGKIVLMKRGGQCIINRVRSVVYPTIMFTSLVNYIGSNYVQKAARYELPISWLAEDIAWEYLDKIRVTYGKYVCSLDAERIYRALTTEEFMVFRFKPYSCIFMMDPRSVFDMFSVREREGQVQGDLKMVLRLADHLNSDAIFCIFEYLHKKIQKM